MVKRLLSLDLNKSGLVLLFMLVMFIPKMAYSQTDEQDRKAILAVMRLEEEVWNNGDIDAYVNLYAPEDSVRMIYSTGAVYGKDNILAFYKKYWPKEKMGKLTLDGERLERLSDEYYYTSGFFHVKLEDKTVDGRFSGLMKKIRGKWYIYVDHSS